jgi:hypothetical protein
VNYLPGLASHHDPPDLCFLSGLDYRYEPQAPGKEGFERVTSMVYSTQAQLS